MSCRSALLLVLLALLGGCSPYVDGFDFAPYPALAEVPPVPPQSGPPLSAYASVMGVRRADQHQGIPTSVQVRLRLDNNGPDSVQFDPRTLQLTNGALMRFPPPFVYPPQPVTFGPQQSILVDAYFPFPPGHSYDDTDLQSLQAHWQVRIGQRSVGQVVFFRRVMRVYYYDPYWDQPPYPYYGWGWGVGVGFRYRR